MKKFIEWLSCSVKSATIVMKGILILVIVGGIIYQVNTNMKNGAENIFTAFMGDGSPSRSLEPVNNENVDKEKEEVTKEVEKEVIKDEAVKEEKDTKEKVDTVVTTGGFAEEDVTTKDVSVSAIDRGLFLAEEINNAIWSRLSSLGVDTSVHDMEVELIDVNDSDNIYYFNILEIDRTSGTVVDTIENVKVEYDPNIGVIYFFGGDGSKYSLDSFLNILGLSL